MTKMGIDINKIDEESVELRKPINTSNLQYIEDFDEKLRSDSLINLCEDLTQENLDIENWLKKFKKYINNYKRLSYSAISNYIFELDINENDKLAANIQSILSFCKEDKKFNDLYLNVYKFKDHVNLAYTQNSHMRKSKNNINEEIKNQVSVQTQISAKNTTSQLIGLVSIFTAISFVVFGGIRSLEGILNSIVNTNFDILKCIIIALIWCFCLTNLLFLFTKLILKIIGNNSDENKSIVNEFPLICTIDSGYILNILFACWVLYLKKINKLGLLLIFNQTDNKIKIISLAFFILFVGIAVLFIWRIHKTFNKNFRNIKA